MLSKGYFISYQYSYVDRHHNGIVDGFDNKIISLPHYIDEEDIEEFEETTGREILEKDFSFRDNIQVKILNIVELRKEEK